MRMVHYKNADGVAVCSGDVATLMAERLEAVDCKRCLRILGKQTPQEAKCLSVPQLREAARVSLEIGQ